MPGKDDWNGEDRRSREDSPWHVEKTVNLGHLLTTITLASGLFVWGSKMDTRVAVLEQHQIVQVRTNEQHEQADRELRQAIKEGIAEVSLKLDRLIWEKRGTSK